MTSRSHYLPSTEIPSSSPELPLPPSPSFFSLLCISQSNFMASNTLRSPQHPIVRRYHFLPLDSPSSSSSLPSSLFKFPLQTPLSSSHLPPPIFSLSSTNPTTATTANSSAISFDLLQQHLSSQDFRLADEETRRLLILLAGEAAQKRNYIFFSEVQFIVDSDLQIIDKLWRKYSNNKFGYTVQKKIWEKANRDFSKFFLKVGWMKRLETEIEQYNYKSFPNEFIWELNDDTPEGHLPLTNALRGTQLLTNILTHTAFQSVEVEEEKVEMGLGELLQSPKPISKTSFTPDYSF